MEDEMLSLTAQIVSAHLSNNSVPTEELPALIRGVHTALATLGPAVAAEVPQTAPAVSTLKSVFPDHLVCLDCGGHFKTLKRHIQSDHGTTPDEYRAKWGLPPVYPMVAPNYAAQRSQLAKASGLGRKIPIEPAPKKRGRPPKGK